MSKPALALVPPQYIADAENLSAGQLRANYPDTYSCWQNSKARAKKLGRAWDPKFDRFRDFLVILGPRPSAVHSLDRIDNTKGYLSDNVRWADKRTQANNRSTTLKVVRTPLVDLARKLNKPASTLRSQKARNWTDAEILAQRRLPNARRSALSWPWPEGREKKWEALYQQGHAAREHRADFMVRFCQTQIMRMQSELAEQGMEVLREMYPEGMPPNPPPLEPNEDYLEKMAFWERRLAFAQEQKDLADAEQRQLDFMRSKAAATGEYTARSLRGLQRYRDPEQRAEDFYDQATSEDFRDD